MGFGRFNNILKVYRFLTSGKGSFSRWRPRWLLGSYNDYISKTIQRRKLVLLSKRRFWAQCIQYNHCKYRRLIRIDKSKMAATQMATIRFKIPYLNYYSSEKGGFGV